MFDLHLEIPGPGSVSWWLLIPPLVVLVVFAVRRRANSPSGVILLLAVGAGLAFAALDPVIVRQYRLDNQLRGAFVIDGSASVWLHRGASIDTLRTQLTDLRGLLADGHIAWNWFRADTELHGPFSSLDEVLPILGTDQPGLHSRREILASLADGGYDFAFLLSDGNLHEEQSAVNSQADNELLPLVSFALPAGWKSGADIGFRTVQAEAFGLLRHPVRIQFELDYQQLASAQTVEIAVQGEEPAAVTQVTIPAGSGVVSGTVDLVVTRLGRSGYRIVIGDVPGWDAIAANNEAVVSVDGYREKLRTLLISGAPGPDTRLLRKALKSDPLIELMHFSILRTERNKPGAPNEELSLIPFPYHELFTKMLPQFDVIILQNFDFRSYFGNRFPLYFTNVADSVRKSGTGLIVTGGPLSMGSGDYQQTTVPALTGLRLTPSDWHNLAEPLAVSSVTRQDSFPSLPDGARVRDLNYATLIPTDGKALRAVVLRPDGPQPLVVAQRVGAGRAVAILSSSLLDEGLQSRGSSRSSMEGWLRDLLRWSAGDLETDFASLTALPATGNREPMLRLDSEVAGVTAVVTGGMAPVYLTQAGSAEKMQLVRDAVARLDAIVYVQGDKRMHQQLLLDPLAVERADLWRIPDVSMESFSALHSFNREDLDRHGVRTALLRGRKVEHVAGRADFIGLLAALALTGWFLIRRSGRRLRST